MVEKMPHCGRILLADDEETFAHSTADLLRREGFECVVVPDAPAAAAQLREAPFDLLIADMRMPGNDRLELIREAPQIAEGLPIILVTGYPSLGSAVQSIRLRVAAYLVKPVDFKELLETVRGAVQYSHCLRALRAGERRLAAWLEDVKRSRGASLEAGGDAWPVVLGSFMGVTLENIVGSLLELEEVLRNVSAIETKGQAPPRAELMATLREAVAVLEKTKNAFKSRELGELRRRLSGMIEAAGGGGAGERRD